jgi:hypothetical protein
MIFYQSIKVEEPACIMLDERNRYSKTNTDATFMCMKEDHMKSGKLKPAYNVQISCENQAITHYSVHQRPGDKATRILHLTQFESFYGKQSAIVVADSVYGSEQNYQNMEHQVIEAFVKYNYFHLEQKRSYKKDAFLAAILVYNREKDFYVVPHGKAR